MDITRYRQILLSNDSKLTAVERQLYLRAILRESLVSGGDFADCWQLCEREYGGLETFPARILVAWSVALIKTRRLRDARDMIESWLANQSDDYFQAIMLSGRTDVDRLDHERVIELYTIHSLCGSLDFDAALQFLDFDSVLDEQYKKCLVVNIKRLKEINASKMAEKTPPPDAGEIQSAEATTESSDLLPASNAPTALQPSSISPSSSTTNPSNSSITSKPPTENVTSQPLARKKASTLGLLLDLLKRLDAVTASAIFITLLLALISTQAVLNNAKLRIAVTALLSKAWRTMKMGMNVQSM